MISHLLSILTFFIFSLFSNRALGFPVCHQLASDYLGSALQRSGLLYSSCAQDQLSQMSLRNWWLHLRQAYDPSQIMIQHQQQLLPLSGGQMFHYPTITGEIPIFSGLNHYGLFNHAPSSLYHFPSIGNTIPTLNSYPSYLLGSMAHSPSLVMNPLYHNNLGLQSVHSNSYCFCSSSPSLSSSFSIPTLPSLPPPPPSLPHQYPPMPQYPPFYYPSPYHFSQFSMPFYYGSYHHSMNQNPGYYHNSYPSQYYPNYPNYHSYFLNNSMNESFSPPPSSNNGPGVTINLKQNLPSYNSPSIDAILSPNSSSNESEQDYNSNSEELANPSIPNLPPQALPPAPISPPALLPSSPSQFVPQPNEPPPPLPPTPPSQVTTKAPSLSPYLYQAAHSTANSPPPPSPNLYATRLPSYVTRQSANSLHQYSPPVTNIMDIQNRQDRRSLAMTDLTIPSGRPCNPFINEGVGSFYMDRPNMVMENGIERGRVGQRFNSNVK